MSARPYRRMKVDELEQLFSASRNDQARLRAILDELAYRSTARALKLKRRIEGHLGVKEPPPHKSSTKIPRYTSPRVDPQQSLPIHIATDRSSESRDSQPAIAVQQTSNSAPGSNAFTAHKVQMDNPSAPTPKPHAVAPELTPSQRSVAQLLEYVRVLIELGSKPAWSLSSYGNVVLHEDDLRNRIGIRHDLPDLDGPIYLKIDRLRRIDPPEPPDGAKDWLIVSRDPFQEPTVQSLRIMVMSAEKTTRLIRAGKIDPQDETNTLKPVPGQDLRDVILRLERFPNSQEIIENYIANEWNQWAETERPRRKIIDIYDRLFSLQQALKHEGSDKPLEVVWGMGVARWKVPPNELDHPLIEQLVELELDESGSILVRPRGVDPILALRPFEAMQNPGTDLVVRFARKHMENLSSDRELSPFEKDTFTPILRYACAQLDRGGRYHPDHTKADDRSVPLAATNLMITDTWVLYARPRSQNFLTADLERLKKAVEETDSLPGPTIALISEPSDEPTYTLPSGLGSIGSAAQTPASAQTLAEARSIAKQGEERKLYFPKAYNDEQIAIVDRLEALDVEGVVVQGPPGTGKTHTIANIICHYLATGRRVLVTSKSEGALAALRDQIPEEVRDLAISLLTSEREGLKQLEVTVNLLASKVSSLDTRSTERDIADGEQRILELERSIDKIETEMREFADKHLRRVATSPGESGILPIELAERIVRERDRHAWFSDRPKASADGKIGFGDKDIAVARSARMALGADLVYLEAELPAAADLPDTASLAAIHDDLANAVRIERGRSPGAPVMSSTETNALARAEALLAAVAGLTDAHEACQISPWLARFFQVWRHHGLDADSTRPFLQLVAALDVVVQRRITIASFGVTVPNNAYVMADLVTAVERAASGQRPFGLLPFGKTESRNVFASIRILGRNPKRPEDWRQIAEVLSWRAKLAEALERWTALVRELSLPEVPEDLDAAAAVVQGHLEGVHAVIDAIRLHVPLVLRELERLFPFGLSARDTLSDLQHARRAKNAISQEVSRHRLASARIKLNTARDKLASCTGPISQRLTEFFSESVGDPDLSVNAIAEEWPALLTELERLRALRPHINTLISVATSIADSGAPNWAQALRSRPVEGIEDACTPDDWREAWNMAWAESYLRTIDGRSRLRELHERGRVADEEMRRLFNNVVHLRTLLTLKARITRKVDAALQMFLAAIRKIGKGTGKSASRLRRDARDAMESSYAAVPCWIMPTWRISESLPASLGSFDLVIFDEASQSDISALPALLRGMKVLIVGDDKQVSPTSAFIEEQKLRSLRMHYLEGQHFGALMLPGNSLYELALASFPGRRIMLKEHFRCVEPIIRFSFQFYADQIVPVRIPRASERISPPLVDVYLPLGRKDRSNRNIVEAEAVVDEVSKIVSDPKMSGRSIGIISLIGSKQAQLIQAMLLERIGEDAYIRHNIACGDSATFQGKERDILLLSMVECPKTRTSKTALLFQQRFNVALSRARDREYLFRSVSEEMLPPDDLKAKVLRHFRNPMEGRVSTATDKLSLCQSQFERDVLTRLLELGFRVTPQVKVGPYSIDLVVEGHEDRRLAVELDGDQYHGPERWAEDMARQRVMERVGWRFWRCWGSSFRLDPDSCIDDLVGSLTSMGIQPLAATDAPTVWTEFRTIEVKDDQGPVPQDQVTTGAQPVTPIETDTREARIGDRVQVQVGSDGRIRVITLTADRDDPDLGFVSTKHPAGAALLGAEEEEEIEFEISGKAYRWMVVKIEKGETSAAA